MGVLARSGHGVGITLVLTLASCGDGTGPSLPGGFSVLEGAANGLARVGSEVRVAFLAINAEGRPAAGLGVSFVVVEGDGQVFAGIAVTNAAGEAREVWTLGTTAGTQALEARSVDPVTGEPRVLGRLELTAQPASPVSAAHADTTVAVVGRPYDLRDAVAWSDEYGNRWIDAPFDVVSVPGGALLQGYELSASSEVSGVVVLRLDTLAVALPLAFITDVREGRWRVQVTCTDPASPDGPAIYDATTAGAVYTSLPYDLLHLPEGSTVNASPWPAGHRLLLGMEGTATYKGTVQPLRSAIDQSFPIWVEHRPGYIDLEASHSPFAGAMPPELGRIPVVGPGPTWEGHYQMPAVDGVQRVSAFCGYLASNTPPDISLQLRTATDVQVSISPN